jgi:hypothetical protein
MDINQYPPNKPNFGLVVALAGATLLLIFVVAYFFVRIEGNHLVFKHHSREPHSQLILPNTPLCRVAHPTAV